MKMAAPKASRLLGARGAGESAGQQVWWELRVLRVQPSPGSGHMSVEPGTPQLVRPHPAQWPTRKAGLDHGRATQSARGPHLHRSAQVQGGSAAQATNRAEGGASPLPILPLRSLLRAGVPVSRVPPVGLRPCGNPRRIASVSV